MAGVSSQFFHYFKDNYEYIHRLPETECYLIKLYLNGITECDVAKMCGRTQASVSHRFRKAWKRIEFMKVIDSFDLVDFEKDLKEVCNVKEIEIAKHMIRTTSQTQTAVLIQKQFKKRTTQVMVKHRFEKCIKKLKETNKPKFNNYLELLEMVRKNLYVLSEVKLPRWSKL